MKRAVVVGATGSLRDSVEALAQSGWLVSGVARHSERAPEAWRDLGIQVLSGDRSDSSLLDRIVAGADLLVDGMTYRPEQAQQLAAWSRHVGATVHISSNAVYADQRGVVDESRSMTVWRGQSLRGSQDGYSANKAECERVLAAEGERVSILRPGKIHGPGCRRAREWAIVKRVLDGRPAILLPGGGVTRESTTSTLNLANAVVACGEQPAHRVVNVADGEPIAVQSMVTAVLDVMQAIGRMPREVRLIPAAVAAPGRLPWSSDKILDTSRLAALLGRTPLSYRESVAREIEWLLELAHPTAGGWELPTWTDRGFFEGAFNYRAEDAYLAELG